VAKNDCTVGGVDERRSSFRYYERGDTRLVIATEYGDQTAVVLDESLGGIGLGVKDAMHLFEGQQIGLRYHDAPLHGCIKAIRRDENGQFRVGIRWLDTRRDIAAKNLASKRVQTSHFFSCADMYIKCDLLEDLGDSASVILWDASTFEVSASRIRCQSVEHRQLEISDDHYASILAGLYEFREHETADDLIETILTFEFCTARLAALDQLE